MTSFRQWQANRDNARKSTGPITEEGKKNSRCNAVRHGLTAETVIGALEDAEDYRAFEAAIIADYDAQSAVERELVLRLASLLWRLRRATTIETGLFEIEANDLGQPISRVDPASREIVYAVFRKKNTASIDREPTPGMLPTAANALPKSNPDNVVPDASVATDLVHCFLRLANLPSLALDRLSRYELMLWRQVYQILLALDGLDRRKPQERGGRWSFGHRQF
jgi:hypothetical protein